MTGRDPTPDRTSPAQDWLPEPAPLRAPSPEIKARLLATLSAAPPPTRSAIARQTRALAIGSWVITLGVFLIAGGVRASGRPLSLLAGTALGIALVAVVAAWAALGRGSSMLGRGHRWLVPIIIGAPQLILAWKIFWSDQYAGALEQWPARPGLRCLALSLSLGLAPLVAFAFARRASDPRRPVLTGLAAGIGIGGISSLLTDLWCPVGYVPHVLLGHFLPIILLGGLGAWLGSHVIAFDRDRARPDET